MQTWLILVITYLILATAFTQIFKLTTKTMKHPAAQTVALEIIAALACFLCMPFFSFKFPENPWTYFFLTLACIFYAINNRIMTPVRAHLEASSVSIVQQTYTVFMTLAGFLLLGESASLSKIFGIILIISSNIVVFWERKKRSDNTRYVWLGVLAYFCNAVAGLIDVGYSGQFNLPFYCAFLYVVPALLIFIFNRVKFSDIKSEFQNSNKLHFIFTGILWGIHYLVLLFAYQADGEVSIIAPITSLTVLLNIIVGYFFLGEKTHLARKLLAAGLAIIGLCLIQL